MLVYLKVNGGPHSGRRIDLKNGQSASFGSTEWADYCFEQDSRMQDVHFQLAVNPGKCLLKRLAAEAPLTVNGEEIEEVALQNGDRIVAGDSVFEIEIDRPAWEADESSDSEGGQQTGDESSRDLTELAEYLQLSEKAIAEAANHQQEGDLLDALAEQKLWPDSLRLQAYLLPAPRAVEWMCSAIEKLPGNGLSPPQQEALRAARDWALDPDDAGRRLAGQKAKMLKSKGPGGTVAMAAFCSEGSLVPEGLEEVRADPRLPSRFLMAAALLAVAPLPPGEHDQHLQKILAEAAEFGGAPPADA